MSFNTFYPDRINKKIKKKNKNEGNKTNKSDFGRL